MNRTEEHDSIAETEIRFQEVEETIRLERDEDRTKDKSIQISHEISLSLSLSVRSESLRSEAFNLNFFKVISCE
ncbi:hypothetical protein L2E82_12568 [Cichorium intybus]|uniref:Uncharacterized protein n=1 Tax=Cichorium intybus TaxID=13427 RepID=A0ACB9GH66_CICIN|nr:hypothetical protein L2E82_12568 [Cichorium intybus]